VAARALLFLGADDHPQAAGAQAEPSKMPKHVMSATAPRPPVTVVRSIGAPLDHGPLRARRFRVTLRGLRDVDPAARFRFSRGSRVLAAILDTPVVRGGSMRVAASVSPCGSEVTLALHCNGSPGSGGGSNEEDACDVTMTLLQQPAPPSR
jgi:hypothetical protein